VSSRWNRRAAATLFCCVVNDGPERALQVLWVKRFGVVRVPRGGPVDSPGRRATGKTHAREPGRRTRRRGWIWGQRDVHVPLLHRGRPRREPPKWIADGDWDGYSEAGEQLARLGSHNDRIRWGTTAIRRRRVWEPHAEVAAEPRKVPDTRLPDIRGDPLVRSGGDEERDEVPEHCSRSQRGRYVR
jgi:hypothetical protein